MEYSETNICRRHECVMNVTCMKNHCNALELIPIETSKCPFYKSRGELREDRKRQQARMLVDFKYKILCEHYGVRLTPANEREYDETKSLERR